MSSTISLSEVTRVMNAFRLVRASGSGAQTVNSSHELLRDIHVISMRKATRRERKIYFESIAN